ncbi:DUF4221 family protein [Algoriphagus sp.]|uniref:DUF4221 family protein n=1 Tax=Algoriphagus sp. TaxID=1872435 RepID=UPI003918F83B
MKKHLLLILGMGLLISACSQEKKTDSPNSNLLENLTVTIDTLRVDVGEELFIAGAYQKGQISPDGKRIYYEYSENQEIHEIDLDEMRLLTRHPLAKDGPDRAPQYVQGFQLLPDNQFFMLSQRMGGIYELNGKKVESIPNQLAEIPGLEELEGISYFPQIWISPDRTKLMAIPFKHGEWFLRLVVVDLPSQTGKLYKLPALDITKDYQVRQEEKDMSITAGDNISSFLINDQLAIGSTSTAEFYLFDWKTDSLALIETTPRILLKQKSGAIRNLVTTQEERWEVSRQLGKMVNYRDLFFDSSRQLYFRLASQNARYDDQGRSLGFDTWLLSYDLDFKLTGEQHIKEVDKIPMNPFFKDGKLYSFTILEEDPGFAVVEFKF